MTDEEKKAEEIKKAAEEKTKADAEAATKAAAEAEKKKLDEEISAREKEQAAVKAKLRSGELSGMSESTAHALLESNKELIQELKELRTKRRGFFDFF